MDPEGSYGKGPKAAGNNPERDEAAGKEDKDDDGQSLTNVLRHEASQGNLCNKKQNFVIDNFANFFLVLHNVNIWINIVVIKY